MNFDQSTQESQEFEAAQREAAEKNKRDLAKAQAAEQFDKLDRLKKNEDFNWFVGLHLIPMLQHEHDEALNLGNGTISRDAHAQRHDILNKALFLLQTEHERLRLELTQI